MALRLAQEKADLFLIDINQVDLEETARQVRKSGVDVVTRRCNMADKGDVAAAVRQAVDRWAGVDVLVNNAGVTYYGITHLMPEDEWDRMLAVNLHGALALTRGLLPWMLARPQAHVLNVCSVLGLVGLPRVAMYSTCKFAMVGFSESLRAEYGRQGLGVTALCPGFVKTNLFSSARPMVEGEAPRQPPGFMCISPERVASRAIKAIRRNQRLAIVEPFAHVVFGAKRFFPGLVDWLMRLGERKRISSKQQQLRSLSDDPTEALRQMVGGGRRAA